MSGLQLSQSANRPQNQLANRGYLAPCGPRWPKTRFAQQWCSAPLGHAPWRLPTHFRQFLLAFPRLHLEVFHYISKLLQDFRPGQPKATSGESCAAQCAARCHSSLQAAVPHVWLPAPPCACATCERTMLSSRGASGQQPPTRLGQTAPESPQRWCGLPKPFQ